MIQDVAELLVTSTATLLRGDFMYPATPEERAAAALLVGNGWHVTEPSCPLCGGYGFLRVRGRSGKTRCTNGCWTDADRETWQVALERAEGAS